MKKAIGYVRVSTEEQVRGGISIQSQKQKITDWAKLNEYDLVEIFVDAGISGSRTENRPALKQAIKNSVKETALVVYSLSRLARSNRVHIFSLSPFCCNLPT